MRFTEPTRGGDGGESNREWSSARDERAHDARHASSKRPRSGAGRSRGGDVSSGKKFVSMSLLTFIVIIVLGAMWGHKAPSDPTGQLFTGLANYPKATTNVPVTQVGVHALATDSARLGVSINFTWTLITGFLVLFMQVGFAFLVTGLTRAKNPAPMLMINLGAFA